MNTSGRPLDPARRHLFGAAASLGVAAAAATLTACAAHDDEDVTANEDLMREHGVIRRALLVYVEAARRLRQPGAIVPTPALLDTTRLFRAFAEDYHERALEEAHIFPVIRRLKSPLAQLPDVLQTQHQRGREITDYVARLARSGTIATAEAPRLATVLDGFVAMYEPHAAREDTLVFPAWKGALGEHAYAEMSEQFEDIERRTFGHDGFEDALRRIEAIEAAFGLGDLATVTAPAPPA